jgi:SAM-dependent methyltransferase
MNATLTDIVKEKYAETARSGLTNDNASVAAVAKAFGYTAEELESIPAAANMGLSCGNPVATAHLRPGEVVVDLGSGGGLDVFLAAKKVGPTGRAIGIDMTPDMIARARKAAAEGNGSGPITNVEFHLASIDKLPLPGSSADVIVSNCVINLAQDKQAVFNEMYRVLKPGGRVAVSDIALKQPLPEALAKDIMAFVGCIAGAVLIPDYVNGLKAAGFTDVAVIDAKTDLNAYSQVEGQAACCSPTPSSASNPASSTASSCCGSSSAPARKGLSLSVAEAPAASSCCSDTPAATGHDTKAAVHDHLRDLMAKYNVNDYAASVKVFAVKPM